MTSLSTCEFCGSALEPRLFTLQGVERTFGYKPCDCEGARNERLRREAEAEQLRLEEEHKRAIKRYTRVGIPAKFAKMDKMNTEAISVSDAINNGLYLWGKSGRGKTYLASAIAKIAVDKRIDTRFASAVDMFTDLTNFDTDTLYRYTDPDLLIIDDLGAEKASEFRLEKLVQIMSAREYESNPTVVTSNLELVSRTGECLAAMWQPIGSIAARRLVSRLSALPKFNLRGVDRRLHVQTAS